MDNVEITLYDIEWLSGSLLVAVQVNVAPVCSPSLLGPFYTESDIFKSTRSISLQSVLATVTCKGQSSYLK